MSAASFQSSRKHEIPTDFMMVAVGQRRLEAIAASRRLARRERLLICPVARADTRDRAAGFVCECALDMHRLSKNRACEAAFAGLQMGTCVEDSVIRRRGTVHVTVVR